MKQKKKTLLKKIKSWGFYEWIKCLLISFMVVIGILVLSGSLDIYIIDVLFYITVAFGVMAILIIMVCLITKNYTLDKYAAILGICTVIGVVLLPVGIITLPDYKVGLYNECFKEKIADGYPEEFVRKYCWDEGLGCGTKHYSETCEPEHCCFTTIEEDKKWNYLEYDKNGNKIKK